MNARVRSAAAMAVLMVMLASVPAWARNPHCAGGIQYLTQALGDKQKGNLEDYQREIQKAVGQLQACATEDPADFEATGYLAWAYGEVDSMCAAGKAFQTAIDGLNSKGDKKKAELVVNNRESFWATWFNKGIASINTAQGLYPAYSNKPANEAEERAKKDATKNYQDAIASLEKARCLKPGDVRSTKNLGAVHGFMGDYVTAERYFKEGLQTAPADSDLTQMIKSARTNRAAQLINENKLDDAMAYYQDLIKTDPNNGDLWAGLADAAFAKARGAEGDAKKPAYERAGDAYAKAGSLKKDVSELHFNAAICYQNAGLQAKAEEQWRAVLAIKPDDREALMNLSTVLTEEKPPKYPDAIAAALKAVVLDPKDKTGHRQLGAMYSKAGDNAHSKQFLLAYLAIDKGKPAEAPTAASGAAGTKVQASMGKPEQILLWEADGQKYETWFYWSKGLAFHFGGGAQLEKTDWSAGLAPK